MTVEDDRGARDQVIQLGVGEVAVSVDDRDFVGPQPGVGRDSKPDHLTLRYAP